MGLSEAEVAHLDDGDVEEPKPQLELVRIMRYEELYSAFLDLGIALLDNGSRVDFFRLAKRGSVHPSYAPFLRSMPHSTFKAIALSLASGHFTSMQLFEAFTKGEPSLDVLISLK